MRSLKHISLLVLPFLLTIQLHAQTVSDDTPSEAIHVSGKWTITVSSPTGEKLKTVQFNNAFTNPEHLSSILAGIYTPGSWGIRVSGDICEFQSAPGGCRIYPPENEPDTPVSSVFNNLTTEVDGNFDLVLTGTVEAAYDGQINSVGSDLGSCQSLTSPDDCTSPQGGLRSDDTRVSASFTTKALDTSLDIQAGQVVTIEVVLGFN